MSPPVITWFFNPALALWPAPHDEVETTCGIEGAIVRILNGHPLRRQPLASCPHPNPLPPSGRGLIEGEVMNSVAQRDCPSGLRRRSQH